MNWHERKKRQFNVVLRWQVTSGCICPLLCDVFKMKSCHYVAVLSDSKQCSVSKVTTHLHCSHGHHIYHLLHGIQWLANQRGITRDDVRWAQLCLSQTKRKCNDGNSYTWRDKVAAPVIKDADWQKNQYVSIAWPLGAWHEVNDKHVPWPDDMIFPARSSQSRLVLLQLWLCIIELGPSSCLECYISSNWVMGIREWSHRVRVCMCVWEFECVYIIDVLTDMSKVIES